MSEDSSVVATYVFRGIEYVVTMNVSAAALTVEVEDRLTADQWRGSFDATYIEDLTHKTGNFKQFSIFISMLESAIKQNSDSVSLDLLTYADLESLRNRKAGAGAGRPTIPGAHRATAAVLSSKRYLILTYTVEFDRIHYPLPLPYMGKPDPRALQDTIRQLRQEIRQLQSQGSKDYRIREIEKLSRENKKLRQQKEETEAELIEYRREMAVTSKGAATKEIRILKTLVKSLEADLLREKNKYQKSSHKKNAECRRLLDEVDELKASERNLKARVKSLTNELALYRRDTRKMLDHSSASRRSGLGSRHNSFTRDRSSSRENSFSSATHLSRNRSRLSRERSYTARDRSSSKERDRSWDSRGARVGSAETGRVTVGRPGSAGRELRRSASQERYPARRDRSSSRTRLGSAGSAGRTSYRFNVSAAGARYPRFNPTAYVEERERKRKEAERKRKRQVRTSLSSSTERRRSPSPHPLNGLPRAQVSRSSSVGSARSRTSSVDSIDSLSEIARDSDSGVESRFRKRQEKVLASRKYTSNIPSSPEISFSKPTRNGRVGETSKEVLASTPEAKRRAPKHAWQKENIPNLNGLDGGFYERSQEFTEIDERLNRLQDLMKKSELT